MELQGVIKDLASRMFHNRRQCILTVITGPLVDPLVIENIKIQLDNAKKGLFLLASKVKELSMSLPKSDIQKMVRNPHCAAIL